MIVNSSKSNLRSQSVNYSQALHDQYRGVKGSFAVLHRCLAMNERCRAGLLFFMRIPRYPKFTFFTLPLSLSLTYTLNFLTSPRKILFNGFEERAFDERRPTCVGLRCCFLCLLEDLCITKFTKELSYSVQKDCRSINKDDSYR